MILKSFGLYLLQKRYHAIWVVLLCAFLPFMRIPTFSITAIIIGLVTLHKGAKEGFLLLCWMILPGIAASFYGDVGTLLVDDFGKGVVIWFMAFLLARTSSWIVTLQSVVIFGVALIVGFHLVVSDTSRWWLQWLMPYSSLMQTAWHFNLSAEEIKLLLEKLSHFATGVLVTTILALDTVLLLLARGWQAVLFNPGGLRLEWRQLRLGYLYSSILLAILVFIWFGAVWLLDILPVVLMPFVFAGLSLVHTKLAGKKNIRMPILITLYMCLLIFSFYACIFLAVLAFLDSWFDFRSLRVESGQT